MAAIAHGAVDGRLSGLRPKGLQDLGHQDRHMGAGGRAALSANVVVDAGELVGGQFLVPLVRAAGIMAGVPLAAAMGPALGAASRVRRKVGRHGSIVGPHGRSVK